MAEPDNRPLVNWNPSTREWRTLDPRVVEGGHFRAVSTHPSPYRLCEHVELVEVGARGYARITEGSA